MVHQDRAPTLNIRTVSAGFYRGFNPVVAMTTKLILLAMAVILVVAPGPSGDILAVLKSATLAGFAGWYIYLLAVFVGFCLVLVMLPISGRVKMGPDDSVPEHNTRSWLAMMFCAGIGVGILVFSVSEPVSHFIATPDGTGAAPGAGPLGQAVTALSYTYLHWGLSAWGCYVIAALALGLACHRHSQPLTMRSAITPLFGRRLEGAAGHAIDVFAMLAIVSGITTTIVLGLEQICSGLSALTGNPFFADQTGNPPLTALLSTLVVAISVAIASVISGVERGVKWTSQLGILLAFGVLAVFVVFGGGVRVLALLGEATLTYVTTLPLRMTVLFDPEASAQARAWQVDWTIFYWAWWIAFAPFVGLFLARISRGRTVRQFILGAMLGPTAMCFIWFAGTGGTALLVELEGIAAGRILAADHAFRIYTALDVILAPGWATAAKTVVAALFLVLIVASTTAAIFAIKSIGAAGGAQSETPLHSMLWAVVIAAFTGAIMAIGGVGSVRDVMIIAALPFSGLMSLMLPSIVALMARADGGSIPTRRHEGAGSS